MRESVLMELEPPLVVSWSAFGSLLVCFFCGLGFNISGGEHKVDSVHFVSKTPTLNPNNPKPM